MPSPSSLPRPLPHPPGFSFGGSLPSHSVGGGSIPSHPLAGGGSLGTPGRTMRDYDETFKEMKKENFNLKLRIFFLEERMGLGGNGGREELARENLELKVALESCRAELEEQTGLVLEASQALERLEEGKGEEKEEEVKRRGKMARSPGPTFSRKINFFSEKV